MREFGGGKGGGRTDVFEEQRERRKERCVVTATNRAGNAWCLDGDRMPEGGKACTVSSREDEKRKGGGRREEGHV